MRKNGKEGKLYIGLIISNLMAYFDLISHHHVNYYRMKLINQLEEIF